MKITKYISIKLKTDKHTRPPNPVIVAGIRLDLQSVALAYIALRYVCNTHAGNKMFITLARKSVMTCTQSCLYCIILRLQAFSLHNRSRAVLFFYLFNCTYGQHLVSTISYTIRLQKRF